MRIIIIVGIVCGLKVQGEVINLGAGLGYFGCYMPTLNLNKSRLLRHTPLALLLPILKFKCL